MAKRKDYEQTKARCPFYRGSSAEKHMIRCEGIGEATSTVLTYREERQRTTQLSVFCQDCYARCEVYRMIVESRSLDE